MKFTTLLALGIIATATACTNPDRFGASGEGSVSEQGAFGAISDPTSPAYFNQTIGDRVFFAVDQSTLSAEAEATLVGQAEWLNNNTGYSAIVEGHADEQGTREYNLALSARRAAAAQNFLISRGVSPNRLRTIPYGKEKPVEVCSTEACYMKNRRAVMVLTAGAGV